MDKTKLVLPGAIIIAGLLIGGAIIFVNKPKTADTSATAQNSNPPASLDISAVSSSDHIMGDPNAPFVFVEYSDLQCPYCQAFHPTMHQVLTENSGKVAWVFRQFPLTSIHQYAEALAEGSECANELGGNDGFWKFADSVYGAKTLPTPAAAAKLAGLDATKFGACLSSGKYADKVGKSGAEATSAGGRGTPFTIIVMKQAMSAATIASIKSLNAQILAQLQPGSPDILAVSADSTKLELGGALPYDLMTQVIKIVAGSYPIK